jgi:hypothetical protein
MPFPICGRHAMDLYRRVRDLIDAAKEDPVAQSALLLAHIRDAQQHDHDRYNSPDHQVYYVKVGNLIKIGTTDNVTRRMHGYPPDAQLLAVEPGGTAVETSRLRQFDHLLAHRKEWFHPGADLLDHIETVRSRSKPGGTHE